MNEPQYYLLENLNSEEEWFQLLKYYSNTGEFSTFNCLYEPLNLNPEIKLLQPELVETGINNSKIYSSGTYFRFRLTSILKDFIFSKPYKEWMNYQFEDLSISNNNQEILATITHEDYIIVLANDADLANLKTLGFEIKSSW